MKIQTPSISFFSGHYQTYGINVQAACDAKCRFITSVCVAASGGTNDIAAFRKCPLFQQVQRLPIGNYIIGDNAYICTENLLTPFSGKWLVTTVMNSFDLMHVLAFKSFLLFIITHLAFFKIIFQAQ